MTIDLSRVYIERCNKETEEILEKESASFLNTSISYFKNHLNEFLYIQSPVFDEIKVDAISMEVDDVFGTYMALFGLKVQKKHTKTIKNFLEQHLHTNSIKNYSALFAGDEGLWEINLPLNFIEGFQEDMTIEQALILTCDFIQNLVQQIEISE
ncbi:branched-chain amino acid aminotransferase [Ureibacillus sp. FSL W8-0352]|uniref:branched-chain amino acid aminotransferase n=1 Tax=Ureibacillus sp. FSL W8-0352 TaxID=2954596 RepID=UPI0030F62714